MLSARPGFIMVSQGILRTCVSRGPDTRAPKLHKYHARHTSEPSPRQIFKIRCRISTHYILYSSTFLSTDTMKCPGNCMGPVPRDICETSSHHASEVRSTPIYCETACIFSAGGRYALPILVCMLADTTVSSIYCAVAGALAEVTIK
jgi:hypothetical protein